MVNTSWKSERMRQGERSKRQEGKAFRKLKGLIFNKEGKTLKSFEYQNGMIWLNF